VPAYFSVVCFALTHQHQPAAPAPDIDQMLEEIEQGYLDDGHLE
jgi:hypothetical protein